MEMWILYWKKKFLTKLMEQNFKESNQLERRVVIEK
jgi:hypothetical protein